MVGGPKNYGTEMHPKHSGNLRVGLYRGLRPSADNQDMSVAGSVSEVLNAK